MGVATVHPSQRRVSCEVCRKHKSRCQRLNRNDPKCARCTLLGVECTTGQQRNIGRPRRTAASTAPSTSSVKKPTVNMYTKTIPPSTSQENAFLSEGACQMDWTSLMSPASTPVQVPATAVDDAFGGAATWSIMGTASSDQYSPPWDAGFGIADAEFMLAHDSAFGISTPSPYTPTSYLPQSPPNTVSSDHRTCLTTINTLEIPGPENANSIDAATALMELSKMNLDLHIRVAAAEINKANLEFNDVIYRHGALYIDNSTLAEFMLKTSQNFLQLLTRLLSTRQSRGVLCASPTADTLFPKLLSMQSQSQQMSQVNPSSCSPPSYPTDITGPLPAPVALTITSIFTQLISLYELILEYITARVERISIDPIDPIPGLIFGGVPLENPCTQGMLFSEAIVHLLERMECALGIKSGPRASQVGLLSARQIKVLWSELDGRCAIIPGHAIMRPATLRRLFGKVAIIFRQISADSSWT